MTPNINNPKFERMGRRRFIKTLTAFGASVPAAYHLTGEAAADLIDDPSKEVPRIGFLRHTNHSDVVENGAEPDREAEYYTISRDKWAVVEGAHDVRRQVQNRIKERFGVELQVGVRSRSDSFDKEIVVHLPRNTREQGLSNRNITVSRRDIENILPTTLAGTAGPNTDFERQIDPIPIRIEESSYTYTAYEHEYRPVPAGAAWSPAQNTFCTTATPAYDHDNSQQSILTAAHCFVLSDSFDFYQLDTSGNADGRLIRAIGNEDPYYDAAVVSPISFNVDYDVAKDSPDETKNLPVTGIVSDSWINDNEGEDRNLRLQGRTSGNVGVDIVETTQTQFAVDYTAQGGDSGGPIYRPFYYSYAPPNCTIAGITSRADDDNPNWTWATRAAYVETELDVTI